MKKQVLLVYVFLFTFQLGHSQFFEGFENTSGPTQTTGDSPWILGSGTWQVFNNGVGTDGRRWTINNTNATPPLVYNGTNAAYMNRTQTGGAGLTSENYLATPAITVPINGKLSFYSRTFSLGNQGTLYQIKVCPATSVGTNPANYTTIATFTEDQLSAAYNVYEQKIINLPTNYVGTQVHIAFVRKNTQADVLIDGDRWLLDDVQVYEGCPVPTVLSASNPSSNSAMLSWNQTGSVNQWEIEVLPAAMTPTGHGVQYNGALPYLATTTSYGSPLTQTPLSPATFYVFYVRAVCAGNILSEWVGPLNFSTLLSPPVCGGSYTDSGGTSANYQNNANETTTICPTNPGEVVTVAFTSFATQANGDYLSVYNGAVADTNMLLGSYSGTTLPPSFTSTATNGCLTFVFTSNGSVNATGWIANISCAPPPVCTMPTSLTALDILPNSINLAWTDSGPATTWQYLLLPVGSPAPTAATVGITASTNPFSITGLNPGTCYNVYLRGDCSATSNGFSVWSGVLNFCTPTQQPTCPQPIILTASNITNHSITLGWTNVSQAASYQVLVLECGEDTPNAATTGWTTASGNTFTINFLIPAQCYKLYVRSDCGTDGVSTWAVLTTNTLAFSCGSTFTDRGGAGSNYNDNSSYFTTIYPTNPGEKVTVTFSSFDVQAGYDALYVFDGTNSASQQIMSGNPIANTSSAYEGGFWGTNPPGPFTSTHSSGALTFWFRSGATGNAAGWVANVTCALPPACPPPSAMTIDSITHNSVNLGWQNNGNGTSWQYIVLPCGSPAPTSATAGLQATTNPFTVTGLSQTTCYSFYVRSVCPGNGTSPWSNQASVTTAYAPLPPMVTNTTTYTPEQLITNVLINNPCIAVSNVTSSTGTNFASTNGIGYFTNSNPTFPLPSGIVLSTGNVANVPGPNISTLSEGGMSWPGDSQLENIISSATGTTMLSKNATKLEFDFTSLNAFMSFNFLFASEEYGNFQCAFSDAFAFLLTDMVSGVTTNLALVPGTTTPISVITIRDNQFNANCTSENPAFFGSYFANGTYITSATNFTGQTVEMTASSAIIPNHPYHIKLVIADRADSAYDSAVFIKGGSFTSGPPQCSDKIELISFLDVNANGVKDSGEANFTYGSFVYQINNTGTINNITSPLGTHTIYDSNPVNSYDFTYNVNSEYAPFYSAGTINYTNISIPLGSGPQTLYFPIVLTNAYNDVSVSIIPLNNPIPGFNYTNKIVYKNLGIASTSGTITFMKDPLVTISSISQSGAVNNATGFSYGYTNLLPYETRTFNVLMNVPTIPTVNLGTILTNNVSISASTSDINMMNNSNVNSQIVVGSYDPNDKIESHGPTIQFNQFAAEDYLYYTIRFQNEGTANAINIKILDILDAQLDETSIRVVNASHSYVMHRVNSQIIWTFDFINLPPAIANDALSKGYVFFKVKLKPGFAIGDIIPNTAEIYFDTNPAIITNTFNTQFTALGNDTFNSDNFVISPNPANDYVTVGIQNSNENIESIVVTDVVGKTMQTYEKIKLQYTNVDVSGLSSGVYLLEITTESKLKVIKKLVVN